MSCVELRNLTKRYDAAVAVNDVSLRIEHGLLVCLLGPSGCGKTTTLRLIAGFVEPTAGEIAVGDRIVSTPARTLPPEQRGMSMIFQSYALWPHMTVAENVAYGLTIRKLPRETIGKKVAAMLATTKLATLAARYPGELSGGQQQRVALARALIVEPETLLLDEPLSNLDANLREEMRFEVRRLHDEYRYTTVYVTHDQSEAMTTADLIAVMDAGRIEQLGTPEEIMTSRVRNSSPDSSARATSLPAKCSMPATSRFPASRSLARGQCSCPAAKPRSRSDSTKSASCPRSRMSRGRRGIMSCRRRSPETCFSAAAAIIWWNSQTATRSASSRLRRKIFRREPRSGSACRRSAAGFWSGAARWIQ